MQPTKPEEWHLIPTFLVENIETTTWAQEADLAFVRLGLIRQIRDLDTPMLAGNKLDIVSLGVTLQYISEHSNMPMKVALEKVRPTPLVSNVDVKNIRTDIILK